MEDNRVEGGVWPTAGEQMPIVNAPLQKAMSRSGSERSATGSAGKGGGAGSPEYGGGGGSRGPSPPGGRG